MNWKRFTRRDACPVCNGDRHDCRQNLDTHLIHCRSLEANPLDYIYRGQDSLGFGMWAYKPDADAWSEERREEWEKEKEARKRERERQNQEELKKLLPLKERDLVIRSILGQLELSDCHRQRLKQRGLTDSQIDEANYRSVKQWQKLDYPVDNRLSGVNQWGNGLTNNTDGILIPIPNEDGLYTALRVNNLDTDINGLGKYLWVSSKNSRGIPIDLPNGELPLAVYFPDKPCQTNQIGLCEGVEYKPRIAANRLGIPVIGFPGSNFSISPKTLEALIKKIWTRWICTNSSTKSKGESNSLSITKTEILPLTPTNVDGNQNIYSHSGNQKSDGITLLGEPVSPFSDYGLSEKNYTEQCSIILIADAGVAINPQISTSHTSTLKMIEGWGYNVSLMDWGQLTNKEGLDIDEIDHETLKNIKLISLDKFREKVRFESRKSYPNQLIQLQEKLKNLTYKPDILLTQDDLIDGKYLPTELLLQLIPKTGIINLKSCKSSGKSHFNKELIQQKRQEGYKIISLVPRIVLGRGQAKEWGIQWDISVEDPLLKKVSRLTLYENQETLGICFDSLWKLADRDFSKTLIIIDEAELGLPHLLTSSTCKDNRPKLLNTFDKLLYNSLKYQGLVLLSDADLSDISVNYVKALAPENTPIFTIVNEAQTVSYDASIFSQKKWIKQEILNAIDNNEKIHITTDSQKEAEQMDRELSKQYPQKKVIRIDSKTTQEDWGRDFVERINESLKKERPDILITTPSMATGTSIDGKINSFSSLEGTNLSQEGTKLSQQETQFNLTTIPNPERQLDENQPSENSPSSSLNESIDLEVKHWFDKVFGIFLGVLTPSQCRQALMRYRQPVPRYIYIKSVGMLSGCRSFYPQEINQSFHEYHDEGLAITDILQDIEASDPLEFALKIQAMVNPETKQWINPHIDHYCQFKARDNYGLANLREIFIEELTQEGHSVSIIDIEDRKINSKTQEFIAGEKQAGVEIDLEEATAISTAEDIPIEQAQAISKKANPSTKELHQAAKAFLLEELPGVKLTPDFVLKAVVKDHRRWLNQVKLYWYLMNPNAAIYHDKKHYQHKFKQFASHDLVFLPDLRSYSPLLNEIETLGLFNVIDLNNPDQEYRSDDPKLQEFKRKCCYRKRRLSNLFNITVSKDSHPIHLVNRFLGKFGLVLKGQQKRIEGKQVWSYKLDLDSLKDPDRLAVEKALDAKWAKIQTKHGLQPVTESPQLTYINTESSVTQDLQLENLLENLLENQTQDLLLGNLRENQTRDLRLGNLRENQISESTAFNPETVTFSPRSNPIQSDRGQTQSLTNLEQVTEPNEITNIKPCSSVTGSTNEPTVNHDVTFFMDLLTIWENAKIRRFNTFEQLLELINRLEVRLNRCYHQLQQLCPDFIERWYNAILRQEQLIG
ncbi:hypothetical protein PCC8801_4533 (plasmid) [Rippkaea orientalis PCC 8801]|uniref:DUF3854 domain-containing protein n=1 Tax=Rippkaea orientalis (strain PCC 8801 / RF-1) TaxID=41431 RepID=B7K6M0_RIPO1|nr:hypothetical protein [Rippkaea orientalis]ACK68442.1 hypothetical protein PCC8801_4533 [Rippkaea orientalis PCC 8801]